MNRMVRNIRKDGLYVFFCHLWFWFLSNVLSTSTVACFGLTTGAKLKVIQIRPITFANLAIPRMAKLEILGQLGRVMRKLTFTTYCYFDRYSYSLSVFCYTQYPTISWLQTSPISSFSYLHQSIDFSTKHSFHILTTFIQQSKGRTEYPADHNIPTCLCFVNDTQEFLEPKFLKLVFYAVDKSQQQKTDKSWQKSTA